MFLFLRDCDFMLSIYFHIPYVVMQNHIKCIKKMYSSVHYKVERLAIFICSCLFVELAQVYHSL